MTEFPSSPPPSEGLSDDELEFLASAEDPLVTEDLWRVYESLSFGSMFPALDKSMPLADVIDDFRIRNAFAFNGVERWSDLQEFTIRESLEWRDMGVRSVGMLLAGLARAVVHPPGPPAANVESEVQAPGRLEEPPRRSEPVTREQLMIRMRLGGATLDQIGTEFGVTRERVRQIIVQTGGPTSKEIRAAKVARLQAEIEAEMNRVDSELRPLLLSRGAMSVPEASTALGIEESTLAEHWPDDLDYLRVWGPAHVDRAWSDEAIFMAIREAALYEYPLTAKDYTELVRVGQVHGPSLPRIYQRFGGWTAACDAAGVESGQPYRDNYQSRWTDAELVQFVRDYFMDPDWPSSAHKYDDWRRARVPDGPSGTTLRNRLGTWSDIKRLALRPREEAHD